MTHNELLEQCDGVTVKSVTHRLMSGPKNTYHCNNNGKISVPDNICIEIKRTITRGTIGRLVDIDYSTYSNREDGTCMISPYSITYIIQVKGRKGTNRIAARNTAILPWYHGPTEYHRTVRPPAPKPIIPPHVNKYNQTMEVGDWIAGIGSGKTLHFGQVVRWTRASVFVTTNPTNTDKKSHRCISMPREAMKLLGDPELWKQTVTMMILQGWKG